MEPEEAEDVSVEDGALFPENIREAALFTGDSAAPAQYPVGFLKLPQEEGGSERFCAVISISVVQDRVLVAVPSAVWHRSPNRRVLPAGALVRATALSVRACREDTRAEADAEVKVWVGYLTSALEAQTEYHLDPAPEGAGLVSFLTDGGEAGYLPWVEALVAVADEKFSFASAVSQESATEARLKKLESGMNGIQKALEKLAETQSGKDTPSRANPRRAATPKAAPGGGLGSAGDLAGLDQGVVRAALAAGIPQRHLEEMAKLTSKIGKGHLPDLPSKGHSAATVLGEEQGDDLDDPLGEVGEETKDGGLTEVLHKLTSIVDHLAHRRPKKNTLEELLDEQGPGSSLDASGVSGGSRRNAAVMKEGAPEGAPGKPRRGFLQHRQSHAGGLQLEGGRPRRAWISKCVLSRMAGTSQSHTEHTRHCACRLVSRRGIRCPGGWPGVRMQGPAGPITGPAGSGGIRQRCLDSGGRSLIGGECPAFLRLREALFTRDERDSVHQAVRCEMDRGLRLKSARERRVHRKEGQVGKGPPCRAERRASRSGAGAAAVPKGQGKGRERWVAERRPRRQDQSVTDPVPPALCERAKDSVCKEAGETEKEFAEADDPALHHRDSYSGGQAAGKPPRGSVEQDRPTNGVHVPGARASTARPETWWNSAFRVLLRSDSKFSIFCKSFLRKPEPPEEEATGSVWPMPVPYPHVYRRDQGVTEEGFALKRAINMQVLALNYLYLRRPPRAPSAILLGRPLVPQQWAVVRELRRLSESWEGKEVHAGDMGRSASKIESLERAFSFLSSIGDPDEVCPPVGSPFPSQLNPRRGYAEPRVGSAAYKPGLQTARGGEVIDMEPLKAQHTTTAKKIEVSRLTLRGSPQFEPGAFLDPIGKQIYDHPLAMACRPEDAVEEKFALLNKLDSTGRLGLIGESEILPGYQSGLFAILKDLSADRLIFDSRPFNTLESPPNRWVASAANAANLCDLQVPQEHVLVASGTDLRDYYYAFKVGHERLVRNTLAFPLTVAQARQYKCFHPRLEREARIYPSLASLAMGDSCAVELAQTAHLALLVQAGHVNELSLMSMCLAPPRSLSMTGVVIDDLICLEMISKASLTEGFEAESARTVRDMLGKYQEEGLIPHEKKTFFQQTEAEFWGAQLDGTTGLVRASLSRVLPILLVTSMVVKIGLVTVGLLEVLVGSWTAAFLFRRRLLSLFSVVYEPLQRGLERGQVLRVSPEMVEELFLVLSLAPLAATDLRAENSEFVYCSDASEWGIGITRSKLPPGLSSEVHRHKLRKSVWVKLLSPLRKLERIKGQLPSSEELPEGQMLPSHPLWLALGGSLRFAEVLRKKVKRPTHINILELRAMIKTEELVAREGFRRRYLSLADSQVALGAWTKGRASSVALNQELQQSLPVHLGCNMQGSAGFLPSEFNSADGPSRNAAPQEPILPEPAWFGELPDLAALDRWLQTYNATPYDLSGLPPLEELRAEADVGSRKSSKGRRLFRSSCKCFASVRDSWSKAEEDKKVKQPGRRTQEPRTVLGVKQPGKETQEPSKKKQPGMESRELPPQSKKQPGKEARELQPRNIKQPGKEPRELHPLTKKRPGMESRKLRPQTAMEPLSSEALSLLQSFACAQFVLPHGQTAEEGWSPSTQGYLDLYSGKKGVAKQLATLSGMWVLTFELECGAEQDLGCQSLRDKLLTLVEARAFVGIGAAVFCSSFSRAVRPSWRDSERPTGKPGLDQKAQARVDRGNSHAEFVAALVAACQRLQLLYWVENAATSFLWRLPCLVALGSLDPKLQFQVDCCCFQAPWRKRTCFFTNCHLRGFRFLCARDHPHQVLRGYSKKHKCDWTRTSQVYPQRLARLLAYALAVDSGSLPGRKRVSAAALAKHGHGGIGRPNIPNLIPSPHRLPC